MIVFAGRNVNVLYANAMTFFKEQPAWVVPEYPSRNGPMREVHMPVVSVYSKPTERVLFDAVRDCNPFLHFFESLWMLAGRNDLKFLTQFTKTFEAFSDDGETLHGAYGYRWRNWSTLVGDQLGSVIDTLRRDPASRRVVLQMWDPNDDLTNTWSKDLPCNTAVYFRLRSGVLDMTVTNRSNDAIWGCYGANAVHFSFLHEYVAGAVSAKVGRYYQVSNSLHIYPEFDVTKRIMEKHVQGVDDPYDIGNVRPYPMYSDGATQAQIEDDLGMFFHCWDLGMELDPADWNTAFFADVVHPMWELFKNRRHPLEDISATDWQLAVKEWMQRRGQL